MQKKAQVSIEFLVILILLFSILLFSLAVFSERNAGFALSRESHEASMLADSLASTINAVYLAGNGAEATVLLEKRVDFNVSVLGRAVTVEWRNNYVDSALLTDRVAVNSLSQGNWVNIRNVNGGIEIENA